MSTSTLTGANLKTVLITGCSAGGIGHALALTYHKAGLRVFATARRLDALTELADAGIHTLELDVTNEDAVRSTREHIFELTGGTLDILVNNAGQSCTVAATDLTPARVKAVFDVNVFGVMNMVHEFAPLLIASKKNPTIVMIGSIDAVIPLVFASAYNATKAALHAYANTLRVELAPFGVNVITMITGGVKSNISKATTLPENSIYKPMEKQFQERRVKVSQKNAMDTFEYAKVVVSESLKSRPRYQVWAGSYIWTAWIVTSLLPMRLMGWLFMRRFGLLDLAKMIKSSKKTN